MKNIKGEFAPYFRGFLALFALSNCQKRDLSGEFKNFFQNRSVFGPALSEKIRKEAALR